MALKKRVKPEETPHESSTQASFTGVPGWAKREAGVMRDGEHAPPGGWVPGYVPNVGHAEAELPKIKKLKKER
jgi:hypothetical protein